MNEVLQDQSVPSLITAIESNQFEAFRILGRLPGAEVHEDPDTLWLISDIPYPLFNSVFRAHLSNADAAIEAAKARCRSRNVPMMWWIGPSTEPADLGINLAAHGFTSEEASGMAADLRFLPEDLPVDPDLVIEPVRDIEAMKKWCRPLCIGFEMPDFVGEAFLDLSRSIGFGLESHFQHYIGWLDSKPVSASSMFLGAGVAGIYNVATVPEARRKGIGAAMTLMPLNEARKLGYRVGILHSSHMGVSVYRALGFREYCKIGLYVWGVAA